MKNLINLLTKIIVFFIPRRFKHFFNYETVSYLFFGGLTTLVSLGFFALFFYVFGMSALASGAISDVLAIVFAFVTNKQYVFESTSWQRDVLVPEAAKFGASRALTYVLGIFALWLLVDVLEFNAMGMRILTIIVIQIIGNYILSKWLVFTGRNDQNEP